MRFFISAKIAAQSLIAFRSRIQPSLTYCWRISSKKATASAVNIGVVGTATAPVYFFLGLEPWRLCSIASFFGYALLLSRRCLGQMIAGTYQNQPTNLAYAVLYTAGFATVIYWIWFPFDLMLANGLFVQIPCLLVFGNTLHGLATGRQTMTEQEYLFECIGMKGECPDCHKTTLIRTNAHVRCRICHAMFFADNFIVKRVHAHIKPAVPRIGSGVMSKVRA